MSLVNGLGADYLLLAWATLSILGIGIAICCAFTQLRGIELLGYGAGAGVIVHALFGIAIAGDRHLRTAFVVQLVFCQVLSLVYIVVRRLWRRLIPELTRELQAALLIWLLFLVACVAVLHLNVQFPATLPDGAYVFKKHTLNVKIQYMTSSLPADNYVPYIVAEYFIRNISFREEHPILPAQEVSNRTILMALVDVPFRSALIPPHVHPSSYLPKFSYFGLDWPDTEKLNDDGSFQQFAIIGIFLNSLLLLGLLVFFSNFPRTNTLWIGALLFATNLYFIGQTIFTWPKCLAGFFIALAWNSLRRQHDPKIVGLCVALAYHSHPYAVIFAVGIAACYLREWIQTRKSFRPILEFGIVFALVLLPWFVWTSLILRLPSDLFAQNFNPANHVVSPIDFLWIRVVNCFVTVSPLMFGVYPFDAGKIAANSVICLPGTVGVVLIIPAFVEFCRLRKERSLLLYGIAIPAIGIISIFSLGAAPVMHGFQPVVGVLLFLGLAWLRSSCTMRTFRLAVSLQLLWNLGVVILQAISVGALPLPTN